MSDSGSVYVEPLIYYIQTQPLMIKMFPDKCRKDRTCGWTIIYLFFFRRLISDRYDKLHSPDFGFNHILYKNNEGQWM